MLAQKTWLSLHDARATRERFGEGCARRPALQLGEVGGGELERLGWRQVLRVPAAPRRGSFLPPSIPLLFLPPLPPPSRLPVFLPPSSLPSLPPDTPTLGPALLPRSLPSRGQNPPARGYLRPPEWPQGPPRSLPAPRRALSRRPPHPRASDGPRGSCSFYGPAGRGSAPESPARPGGSVVNVRYSHRGAAAGSPGASGRLPPIRIHRAWVGVRRGWGVDKQGLSRYPAWEGRSRGPGPG